MSLVRLKQLAQEGASDGQAAVWNNSTSQWEPASPAHGDQAGGALHALAIAAGAAGFLSGADKTKLDGLSAGIGTIVQANAAGTTTTVLDTPVLMASMSISPSVTGTYLIFFSTTISNSSNNILNTISVYVNGVEQSVSIRQSDGVSSTDRYMMTSILSAVVTAGQLIEVLWSTGGGTCSAYQRSLIALKVG